MRNWGGPNAVRRQTEFIIKKRLEPALKAGDSSWAQALKAQIYVPTAADIPDALDVWQQPVPYPCAITAVPTKGFGFVDGVVEINLLARRDGAKREKEVLKVDLPSMSSYGAHVRAGELVLCSGVMPIAADGHVVGKSHASAFDGLAHAAQTQALTVLSYAERVCKTAGAPLSNLVRAQWFMCTCATSPASSSPGQSARATSRILSCAFRCRAPYRSCSRSYCGFLDLLAVIGGEPQSSHPVKARRLLRVFQCCNGGPECLARYGKAGDRLTFVPKPDNLTTIGKDAASKLLRTKAANALAIV